MMTLETTRLQPRAWAADTPVLPHRVRKDAWPGAKPVLQMNSGVERFHAPLPLIFGNGSRARALCLRPCCLVACVVQLKVRSHYQVIAHGAEFCEQVRFASQMEAMALKIGLEVLYTL